MATQRFGHLDDFTLKNTNVGIGTSTPQDKMEVIGGTRSTDLRVAGIATLTSAGGFIEKHTGFADNVKIIAGDSGTLSGEIVVGSGLTMTVGTAATTSQGTVDALKVYDMFQPPSGGTNQRPPAKTGAIFYNFDFKTIEFFDGNSWRQVDNTTRSGRGFFCGGNVTGGTSEDITSIIISTRGKAVDFGTMVSERTGPASCANEVRGLIMGGSVPGTFKNDIDYFSTESGGQAVDFGNLTQVVNNLAAVASSTRGLRIGGSIGSAANKMKNVIDYVEIMTTGNSLDFGDITTEKSQYAMTAASPTRAVICGGGVASPGPGVQSSIEHITMASKGNSVNFGEMPIKGVRVGTVSNTVRAVHHSGYTNGSAAGLYYLTIASEGNSTEFGELDRANNPKDTSNVNDGYTGGCSNNTRAVWMNGSQATDALGFTSYIEIASGGKSISFGDAERQMARFGASSNAHGGLGGF